MVILLTISSTSPGNQPLVFKLLQFSIPILHILHLRLQLQPPLPLHVVSTLLLHLMDLVQSNWIILKPYFIRKGFLLGITLGCYLDKIGFAHFVRDSGFTNIVGLFSAYVVNPIGLNMCASSHLGVNPWILDSVAVNNITSHNHLLHNLVSST